MAMIVLGGLAVACEGDEEPDGEEGWVKSAYLVTEKPPRARLSELEAELEAVRAALRERETALLAAEEAQATLSR